MGHGEAGADYKLNNSVSCRSVLSCLVLCAFATALLVGMRSDSTGIDGRQSEQIGNARKLLQYEEEFVTGKKTSGKKQEKVKKTAADKQQSKKQQQLQAQSQANICESANYSKSTLTLVSEMHFDNLFPNVQKKMFEGSDVIQVGNSFYVVFDNLYEIGRIDARNFSSLQNFLLPPSRKGKTGSSGYEAIAYDDQSKQFFVVIESEPGSSPTSNHGVSEQMQMGDLATVANFVQRCETEFIFTSENKGLEGAAIVRIKKRMYMIGLCEGNYCMGGNKGKEVGNGRLVVMQRHVAIGSTVCSWQTVKEIPLPPNAAFQDYSALALRKTKIPDQFDIAVVSQENSQMWIGRLTLGLAFDLSDWIITSGVVYNFPRDEYCGLLFCSVEGIAFLDENKFVAVSDVGGGTASGCAQHDETIHIFQLP